MSDNADWNHLVNRNDSAESDKPVWGAAAIGRLINKNPRQTHHLLARGLIKSARQVGHQWTAIPSALRREFGA
jgi:hypothetical protein